MPVVADMAAEMPVEPLASVIGFAVVVTVLCVAAIGYALGYDIGHGRASAEAKAWRDAVAAEIRRATGACAYPRPSTSPPSTSPEFERRMRRVIARQEQEGGQP